MDRNVKLDDEQIDRLLELTGEYRDGVTSGGISGFHQSVAEELADVDVIVDALRDAR